MKNSTPIMAKKSRPTAETDAEKLGLRNNRTSSAGCSLRSSYHRKMPRTARPPSAGTQTPSAVIEPRSPPSMTPYTSSTSPATDSSTPPGSSRPGFGSRDSGTSHRTNATPIAITGMLMRNTEPHQNDSSSRPPTTGPITTASPTEAVQMPIALPRSSGSKTLLMIDNVEGITAAPPMPISARATISCSGDCAYADASDARPNRISPTTSIRLRPNRSPSSPNVKSRQAKTSVYELMDQANWLWVAPKSSWISFRATLSTVLSRTTTSRLT